MGFVLWAPWMLCTKCKGYVFNSQTMNSSRSKVVLHQWVSVTKKRKNQTGCRVIHVFLFKSYLKYASMTVLAHTNCQDSLACTHSGTTYLTIHQLHTAAPFRRQLLLQSVLPSWSLAAPDQPLWPTASRKWPIVLR